MRKKRGSILIYVMAIFAVLMIMGATLTTLTMQSMKNRKYYSNNRMNLYYSESGIDEAYGITAKYVEIASNDALNKTNKEIETLINEDKVRLEEIFRLRESLNNSELTFEERTEIDTRIKEIIPTLVLFTGDGELDGTRLKKKQKIFFGINYIGFLAEKPEDIDSNLEKLFYDLQEVKNGENADGSNGIVVTNISKVRSTVNGIYGDLVNREVSIESEELTENEKLSDIENLLDSQVFNINIKSTFENEAIERIISTDFRVMIPDYGSKIKFLSKYVVFTESPIWSKGIVVNKILNIKNAPLTVDGDVYVKGDKDSKNSILLNSKGSKLIVDGGDVTANEGVKFNYNSGAVGKNGGAEVTIGGSLYTKGILFNEGAQGGTLDVTGSIYVLDDCEINAKNSTLKVNKVGEKGGSYYGVSDGEGAADNEVDNSSAIIINSEDLGDSGSTVNIGDKVYLAGTAYIKGLNNPAYNGGYAYQTGESISIKGNYKAYTETLEGDLEIGDKNLKYDLEKTMLDPLILATHYSKTSNSGENFEAFVSTHNRVFITMTLSGKLNKDFNGAASVKIDGEPASFDEFIQSDKEVGDRVTVDIYDSAGDELSSSPQDLMLKSYKTNFEDFNVFDKSEYFAQYYKEDMDDTGEERIINNGDGIKIGTTEDSIHLGAIISSKGALSTSYTENVGATTENDNKMAQKKAVLKDKMFYMNIVEKKYFNRNSGSTYVKEIEALALNEYTSLDNIGTIEATDSCEISPDQLLDFGEVEEDITVPGLYIRKGEEVVTELPNKKITNYSYGIIICEGDIKIESDFNFTGTIITLGNLTVEDEATVSVTYDDALVKRIVAMNYAKLINVFTNVSGYELDKMKVEIYDDENEDTIAKSKPLTIEKWAVIK